MSKWQWEKDSLYHIGPACNNIWLLKLDPLQHSTLGKELQHARSIWMNNVILSLLFQKVNICNSKTHKVTTFIITKHTSHSKTENAFFYNVVTFQIMMQFLRYMGCCILTMWRFYSNGWDNASKLCNPVWTWINTVYQRWNNYFNDYQSYKY